MSASTPTNIATTEYLEMLQQEAAKFGLQLIAREPPISSMRKATEAEADTTWENTSSHAVGRIGSGQNSETWIRVEAEKQPDPAMVVIYPAD